MDHESARHSKRVTIEKNVRFALPSSRSHQQAVTAPAPTDPRHVHFRNVSSPADSSASGSRGNTPRRPSSGTSSTTSDTPRVSFHLPPIESASSDLDRPMERSPLGSSTGTGSDRPTRVTFDRFIETVDSHDDDDAGEWTYEELSAVGESLGDVTVGVDAATMAARTTLMDVPDCSPPPVCTICLDALPRGTRALRLECLHIYHVPCIETWLSHRNTCPVCKHRLEPVRSQRQ